MYVHISFTIIRKEIIDVLSIKYVSVYLRHKSYSIFQPFLYKPWLLLVCSASLLKTLQEKEELLVISNFSFSHSLFYPSRELSAIFIKFEVVFCKTLSIKKSLKFVIWERVKRLHYYVQ